VDNVVDEVKFQRKNSGKSAVMGGGGQKMTNFNKYQFNQLVKIGLGRDQ